jgi:hypothetical protein
MVGSAEEGLTKWNGAVEWLVSANLVDCMEKRAVLKVSYSERSLGKEALCQD